MRYIVSTDDIPSGRIGIYGCGGAGESVARRLIEREDVVIERFFDSYKTGSFLGLPVVSPDEKTLSGLDAVVVASHAYEAIGYGLEALGCDSYFVFRTDVPAGSIRLVAEAGGSEAVYGRPVLFVETTNRCNIGCNYCPNRNLLRPRGMMNLETFSRAVEGVLKSDLFQAIDLVGMGETFLNPDVFTMIDMAHERGVTVIGHTNGKFTPDTQQLESLCRLSYLDVTIDAVTEETMAHSRPATSPSKLFETVARVLAHRGVERRPHVNIHMNVFRFNQSEIPLLIERCNAIGVDSILVNKGAAPEAVQAELSTEDIEAVAVPNVSVAGFGPDVDRCGTVQVPVYDEPAGEGEHWFLRDMGCPAPSLKWNGDLTVCCFDYESTIQFGNINEESLGVILSSARLQALRDALFDGYASRMAAGKPVCCDLCATFASSLVST